MAALPQELRIARNNLGTPAAAATFTPAGIVVVAVQRSFTAALAGFDDGLGSARVRTLASNERATWDLDAVATLPDGRLLLCTYPGPDLSVDATTLEATPAVELVGAVPAGAFLVSEKDVEPRDAFVVGGRLVVGHGARYSGRHGSRYFSEVPANGAPVPWAHDLGGNVAASGGGGLPDWHAHRSAVVGDAVVLAGQALGRSGSTRHALVALEADGAVRHVVPRDRALIRDPRLALVADRGRLLVSAKGLLDVLDGALERVAVARADHPFTVAFELLAGDGAGRLLWYDRKRYLLLLTGPEELAHDALDESLDRLAADAAEAAATQPPARRPAARRPAARKAARQAAPKAKRVARHTLDTGLVDEFLREQRRELLEVLDDTGDTPAVHKLVTRSEGVLAHASVFDRDDPIVWQAVRALAQGLTAELLKHVARGRGAETVDVPFADRVVTVPSRGLASVSSLTWCDAWYAATVAGETRCLDRLDTLGDDEVESGRSLAHSVEAKHALQAYRAAPASAMRHVRAALAASSPENFRTGFQGRAHAWRTAVYPMLVPLLAGDAAGFDAALLAALTAHKKFFGTKSESNALRGWVALGPQAMCCLAHDRGVEPTVESGYLVPALTERRFSSA